MKFIQKNIILVAITIAIVLGGGFYYLNQPKTKDTKSGTNITQEKTVVTKVTIKADGKEKNYEVENAVGKTALAVTEEAAKIEKTGDGKDSFITSINGRKADGSKNEFWKLVINGRDAEVGAGSYTVAEKDAIAWEIDTY